MQRTDDEPKEDGERITEGLSTTFCCSAKSECDSDVDAPIVRRCETVGRVYPHVHAKIVSPDDPIGKPLPVGHPGELCVSAPLRCKR